MGSAVRTLGERSRDVLGAVVRTHIESAAPVSSRQLTKLGTFGLSSASLRNMMADLEDLGFLTHPHVSSGRVPTDLGYRTFVSELMATRSPRPEDRARIASELTPETFEMDRFFHGVSRLLSSLTGEVGVVAAPPAVRFVLRSVHFTRVADRKVVVVQVSGAGLVESRLIETRDDFAQLDLDVASRRLTADYGGRTLAEIRRLLLESLHEEKVRVDAALQRTLELGQKAFAEDRPSDGGVIVEGTEALLSKPEFQRDMDALRRMLRGFEERARLVSLLTDCLSAPGTTVVIGSENDFTGETQSAVVTATYRCGENVLGVLGVIGPRRMEYEQIVPIVEELGRVVTDRLTDERRP
ncbi:MAG TPA: heat-inducible transcriptional repressor HrcA [Thermoanaerobaculia bacterium]|nr:heat-inducible transcriptional repressor HrcA [Thermoanaerobaculia bacterium]